MFYKLFFFITLLFIAQKVQAQEDKFKELAPQSLPFVGYTDKNGLSNSHVNAIGQDEKGYIWIATNDGLNRFDGNKFENFYYTPEDKTSINSNTIYTIFKDRTERIWFGTFKGLCTYNYKTGEFETIELPKQANTIQNVPVRGIVQTNNGDLWVGLSGGGIAQVDLETNQVKYYRHNNNNPNSLCSDGIIAMAIDQNDNIWIGTEDNGISIYDTKEKKFTNINKSTGEIGSNVIRAIICTSDNKIAIGTYDGGLTIYNPESKQYKTYNNCQNVCGIAESDKHELWLGTETNGLLHFNMETEAIKVFSKKLGNAHGLLSDNIHAVFCDKDQNLWLGIFQCGVNMLKPKPMFSGAGYNQEEFTNGISQKPVLAICPIDQETVYLGTDGDGMQIWNPKDNTFEHIRAGNNGLKSNVIRSIYKDHNNRIWIGTYLKGLMEYHPETKTFTQYQNQKNDKNSLSHNDVPTIIEDRLGNLWIGTNGGGLNLMNKETGTFKNFQKDEQNPNKTIINNYITSLYIDKHGYLWIGTFWGLSRMDPVKCEFKNFELEEDYNSYNCMLEDSQQRFWAGTSDGLKLINITDGTYKIFTTKDGLPNNVINAIEEDNHGNLWISTDKGICRFNYDNMSFRKYSTYDGLFSNEFIHGSMAKSDDGEIYFGGIEGVTKFNPQDIKSNDVPPRIAITDLLVFNKSVKPGDANGILKNSIIETDAIQLNWEDNSFTIVFSAIEYCQPQKIVYAWRMDGFNNNWEYFNYQKNSATYTNLDAGIYYFEVKASNDGETWSNPIVLRIKILAPIWKRWWMILIYCITFAIIVLFFWRKYKQYEEEKHQIKIQYIKQQNDIELNKTRLQFFTNISHEFRTPLTLILSPLEEMLQSSKYNSEERNKFDLMHRNAERLLRMVNQIMDLRKFDNNKFQFNPTKNELISFIREIYENFNQLAVKNGTTFTMKSDLKEFYAYFDKEQIDKVMYNLLSNAFKFTPEDGKISILIKKADKDSKNIVIIVEDNGKGISEENIDKIFDRFFQGDTSKMQQGTGIGLWLTKRFVEMHQGIISVSSEVGKGTAFTIMLTDGSEFEKIANKNTEYQHLQVDVKDNNELISMEIEKSEATTTPKYTLLIVEDNEDIRNYLSEGLSKLYNVKTADNGKTGLQMCKELLPDLVITDIMMPEMSGIEMSKIIKEDIETCHIPIIMLTAKSSEEQRIEGLETGADSYIPKPFNPKHLLVRIKKLLELRKTLREKFGNDIGFEAEQIAITVPDRDLLKKATGIIKKRISDPKLSVETLSEEIGISRGHLQRKLKSLTGQNPNEFIRIIRLKQAAEILAEKDVSIAEVADMVGFSSQSYFSTSFTKQFNISPSQYKEELMAK